MGLVTGLALGATALGSVISARSASNATQAAAETSSDNNTANVNLAREIYGNNEEVLSPFVDNGVAASNQINALLGLGGSTPQQQTQVQPNALTQFGGNQPAGYGYGLGDGYISPGSFGNYGTNALAPPEDALGYGGPSGGSQYTTGMPTQGGGIGAQTGTQGQTSQQAANSAFDTFRNSTGYQFRLGEGMDQVTSAYAGIGGFQSGAALRGITEYGQNFASNEFGNYMNVLSGQQAVGAGAASSLAGVGQNFAGTVIDSNNQNTTNQMNAQLANGNNNALGNTLGLVGGGLLGLSG